MISRHEYVTGKFSHREYYAQFVTSRIKAIVTQQITLEKLLASTDEHLNDIPMSLWDRLPSQEIPVHKMRQCGDYLTSSGEVCIFKEAAQQIIESFKENNISCQ